MPKYLAKEMKVHESVVDSSPHFNVTQKHHPDIVARIRHFPGIQSITVSLNLSVEHAFKYSTDKYSDDSSRRRHSGLLHFDQTWLHATFSIEHICSLSLGVPCGDRLCALPWQDLIDLRELSMNFKERVAQGTFGFLPRIPSLEALHADIDFLSVPCLVFLTNLTSLDISLAPPEKGYLNIEQALERDDEVLSWISKLSTLKTLDFSQQASKQGVARLTALPKLTSLVLRLPSTSDVALSVWEVQSLFQGNTFHLKHLQFEFKLDGEFATARMLGAETDKLDYHKRSHEMQFCVPWSAKPILLQANITKM